MGRKPRAHEDFRRMVEAEGYKCLSNYQTAKSRVRLMCDKGHRYSVAADTFIQGHRCGECYAARQSESHTLPSAVYSERAIELGYRLIPETFQGSQKSCGDLCPNGHTFHRRPHYLYMGCQECNKSRKQSDGVVC